MPYSENQVIQWLDVPSGKVRDDAISACYAEYFTKAYETDRGMSQIDFSGDERNKVKISDWKGWSDLIYLKKIPVTGACKLCKVTTEHGKSISVFADSTLIPIYDNGTTIRGFHGESKYPHRIVLACGLLPGDTVRVLHLSDDNGTSFDFDKVADVGPCDPVDDAYEILTKSGYVNIGDIYVFAGTLNQAMKINQSYTDEQLSRHRAGSGYDCTEHSECCCNGVEGDCCGGGSGCGCNHVSDR